MVHEFLPKKTKKYLKKDESRTFQNDINIIKLKHTFYVRYYNSNLFGNPSVLLLLWIS